jgi:hypothetical protein
MQFYSTFADPFFSQVKIKNIVDMPEYYEFSPKNDMYIRAVNVEDIDFEDDPTGDDLDVPGSEDDDEQEAIGNEDEENNYYSLAQDEQSDSE